MFSLCKNNICISSILFDYINLFTIINWIFYWCLWLVISFLNYGLITQHVFWLTNIQFLYFYIQYNYHQICHLFLWFYNSHVVWVYSKFWWRLKYLSRWCLTSGERRTDCFKIIFINCSRDIILIQCCF